MNPFNPNINLPGRYFMPIQLGSDKVDAGLSQLQEEMRKSCR